MFEKWGKIGTQTAVNFVIFCQKMWGIPKILKHLNIDPDTDTEWKI